MVINKFRNKNISLVETYKEGFEKFKNHWKFWIIFMLALIAINIGETIIYNYLSVNLVVEKIISLFVFLINNVLIPIFVIAASWQSLKNKKVDLKKFEKNDLNFDMILNMLTWAVIEIFGFVLLPLGVFYIIIDKSKPLYVYIQAIKTQPIIITTWALLVMIVYVIIITRFMFVEYNIVIKKKDIIDAIMKSWKDTKKYWGLLVSYYLISGSILVLTSFITFGILLILLIPWYWLSTVYIYERITK